MSHRSTRPARLVFTGSRLAGERYIAYGRTLLGEVIESAQLGGIETHSMTRRVGPATIKAWYSFGDAQISIDVPFSSGSTSKSDVQPALWVPRGFVFYPISDTSLKGWGVPSIDIDYGDPYALINRAPGLDTARWTVGGQLGEVLVTTLPNAGYPEVKPGSLNAPLLFHPVYGLRPQKTLPDLTSTWAAYRIEFDDYTAQDPALGPINDPVAITFKQRMFELVNELRLDTPGRTELMLPVRGYYDSAQATAEVMAAAQIVGHFSEEFAPTYETEDDRGSKDGMLSTGRVPSLTAEEWDDRNETLSIGENLTGNPGGPTEIIGTDPLGLDITRMPPGPRMTAQECFDQFLTSAEHTANMKAAQYDFGGTASIGSATSLGVGFHTAYYAQHFIVRHHWIASGNCYWQSQHAGVPIVSWDGFNAMNLAWETWPIRITADLGAFTATASLGRYFTTPNGSGYTELTALVYTDTASSGSDRRFRPAMSPRIYARGRCIAVAPRGGLVWAAAAQKLPVGDEGSQSYRLVALVHHDTDHAVSALTSGYTPKLRVWYIDLPDLLDFPLNPVTLIRGVYGEEDIPDDWPWITTNSPYSWRGGALVDVSDGDTLLKYASVWRFNTTGTKAVCLRDFGTRSDYETEYLRSQSDPPGAGVLGPTIYADYPMSGQLGVFTGARWVKYLEIDVTDTTAPSLFVSDVNFGAAPHKPATTYSPASTGSVSPAVWVRPAAVDYAYDGTLLFAHHVIAYYAGAYQTAGVMGDNVNNSRHGICFSADWDVTWPDAAPMAIWYSTVVALPDEPYMGALASVIDVRDKVWAHVGAPCSAVDTGENGAISPNHPDYPLYVSDTPDSLYRTFDFTADCTACVQIPAEHVVRMYRNGVLILSDTVANTDDLVHDFRLFPNTDPRFMPWSLNPALQATYVKDLQGAWAATLAYLPQAGEAFKFDPSPPPGAETTYWGNGDNQCYNACGEGWQESTRPTTGFTETRNGGGGMTSSFASGAELAALMQIPGGSPRSPFVRVV